ASARAVSSGEWCCRDSASCPWTPGSWPADFPAPTTASTGSRSTASVAASWRTTSHASHSHRCCGPTPDWSWAGTSAPRAISPWQPSRRPCAPAGTEVCPTRCQRRTDEGLCSTTTDGGVERADADYAQYHDYRGHQRKGSRREARYQGEGFNFAPAVSRRVRHDQPDAGCRTGQRNGEIFRRRYKRDYLRRGSGKGC